MTDEPLTIRETALATASVLLKKASEFAGKDELNSCDVWQRAANILLEHAAELPTKTIVYEVYMTGFGDKKINVIKAVRESAQLLGGHLGLKDAKDLVEKAPCILFTFETEAQATKVVAALHYAGAEAIVQRVSLPR